MRGRSLRYATMLTLLVGVGCSGAAVSEPGVQSTASTTTTGSGAGGTGGGGATTTSTETNIGGNFGTGGFTEIPVKDLPGLMSITFHERTGGTEPTPYVFTVDGPELTVRLDDPLTEAQHDIPGATTEYYDVYYSDGDGVFQLDGSYLTISGVFQQALPAGGGLNLAEIGLDFADSKTEFGNYVASFVALGDNAAPTSVTNCIDGDLQTHTTMGNTVGAGERLRLTLGFESTSGPPPK